LGTAIEISSPLSDAVYIPTTVGITQEVFYVVEFGTLQAAVQKQLAKRKTAALPSGRFGNEGMT